MNREERNPRTNRVLMAAALVGLAIALLTAGGANLLAELGLAVNASEPPAQVQQFMDELVLTFPALLDPDAAISDLYSVRIYPTTTWIDADGIVQAQHFGPLTETQIAGYVEESLGQ